MDIFGIGTAMKAMVNMYLVSGRNTGKTAHLVEYAKDGDIIIFRDQKLADEAKRLCRDKGKDVGCYARPGDPRRALYELGQFVQRTKEERNIRVVLDHSFVMSLYEKAIDDTQLSIEECLTALNSMPEERVIEKVHSKWYF